MNPTGTLTPEVARAAGPLLRRYLQVAGLTEGHVLQAIHDQRDRDWLREQIHAQRRAP